jgi:hypothetical protein
MGQRCPIQAQTPPETQHLHISIKTVLYRSRWEPILTALQPVLESRKDDAVTTRTRAHGVGLTISKLKSVA